MKKIEIPKEKLVELYVEKKMTMHEIAEIYDVDRTTISNKLKSYEIDSNPSHRKYYHLKAIPLTQDQKDFIVGTTLGDGSVILGSSRKTSYFKVGHCEKQKEYVFYKKSILGNLVNDVTRCVDKRGNSIMYNFHTISHNDLNFYRDLFYVNNKKVIKEEIKDHLTVFGLAMWYMDDGSKGKSDCRIATDGFTKEENEILRNILKEKFNLVCNVHEYSRNDKKYYYLLFNKQNTILFHEMIKNHVIDCMKYKLLDCSSTTTCQNSVLET